jgi:hypothetical protein
MRRRAIHIATGLFGFSTATLRRSSTVELIIGVLVVAATAVLVAVPTPFLR